MMVFSMRDTTKHNLTRITIVTSLYASALLTEIHEQYIMGTNVGCCQRLKEQFMLSINTVMIY